MHNLLFCLHTLCMNYVTNTFLLVSSSVSSKQLLCVVHGQDQKSEQKHTTKNFVEFHNHSPLLTMMEPADRFRSIVIVFSPLGIRNSVRWYINSSTRMCFNSQQIL